MTEDQILDMIIANEGGFVDHPDDRGGATKYGITIKTLRTWRGSSVTVDDVRALSKDEAREIYRQRYVRKPRFDAIRDGRLRAQVIDAGVLAGPAQAARMLQRAAGATADGVVGPRTLAAVNRADPVALNNKFMVERILHLAKTAARRMDSRGNPIDQRAFLVGWMNRATKFLIA